MSSSSTYNLSTISQNCHYSSNDNNSKPFLSLSHHRDFSHPPSTPSLLHVLKDEGCVHSVNSFREKESNDSEDTFKPSSHCSLISSDSLTSCVTFIDLVTFLSVVRRLVTSNAKEDVILDARENRLYQTNHIKCALTTSCHTKIMAKRSIAFYASIDLHNPGNKCIYIYDQKTSKEQASWNSNLELLIDYLLRQSNQVFIVDGGWSKLKEAMQTDEDLFESCLDKDLVTRYTYSPTNCESASEDVLNAMASKITNFLWLGNERDARDLDLLRSLQITHVINVTKDVPNFFEENNCGIKYCRLSASDNHSQDLLQFFDQAFGFIENARNERGHVLVHCWAGVSRSPTIVLSYLIRHLALSAADALRYLQRKRNIIAPNFSFMGQLEKFYNMLKLKPFSSMESGIVSPVEPRVSSSGIISWSEIDNNVFITNTSPGSECSSGLGDSLKSSVQSTDDALSDSDDIIATGIGNPVCLRYVNRVDDADSAISSASEKNSPSDIFSVNFSFTSQHDLSQRDNLVLNNYCLATNPSVDNALKLDSLSKESCSNKNGSILTGQVCY